MHQNIALSPLFFEGLEKISIEKKLLVLSLLQTERFLCDEDNIVISEYNKMFESLNNDSLLAGYLPAFIKRITLGNAVICENAKLKERTKEELKKYESEKLLALNDDWKVILTKWTDPSIKSRFESENDIQIAGISEYLNPNESSRIRAEERIIKRPGENFNFRQWIHKYVRNAKYLQINDGYICSMRSIKDLIFLLTQIDKNMPVTIITLADSALKNQPPVHPDRELLKIKKQLSLKNLKFKLISEKKELMDRSLTTDLWRINLGHSFGSVSESDNVVKRQFEITVKRKLK